jgi:hypothetical protein
MQYMRQMYVCACVWMHACTYIHISFAKYRVHILHLYVLRLTDSHQINTFNLHYDMLKDFTFFYICLGSVLLQFT